MSDTRTRPHETTRAESAAASLRVDPWLPATVVIRGLTPEVEDVTTYELSFTDPARAATYRFHPGQFNMLYLPGVGEIAISVSGDPAVTNALAHTVRAVGQATRELARLSPGATLGLRGPFGSSWPLAELPGRDVVILAGGIGLAPLRPVIYALLRDRPRFGTLTLLYGARTPDLLLFDREYNDWTQSGVNVLLTVDRAQLGWRGNVSVVTLLVDQLPQFHADNTVVLCCGPEVMMRFAAESVLDRGVPESRIWVSLERNMQCAIGFCGHCQLGPEFVCRDGPVFRYDRVAPYLKVEGL